jgi:hypothetical protein
MSVSKLEAEFDWREAEIAHIKKLYVSTPKASAVRPTILKSLILLRYAHFEGFIRSCLNTMLDEVNRANCQIRDLARPFSDVALEPLIIKIRRSMDNESVCRILSLEDSTYLDEVAVLSEFADSGNLWPDRVKRMLDRVGIEVYELDTYRSTISALVGIRNDIAHGKNTRVNNLEDYEMYEYGALAVCLGIILDVQKSIDERRYLKIS